jgi:hypothetical protein
VRHSGYVGGNSRGLLPAMVFQWNILVAASSACGQWCGELSSVGDFHLLVSIWLAAVHFDRCGCDWPPMPVAGSLPLRQLADGGSLKTALAGMLVASLEA